MVRRSGLNIIAASCAVFIGISNLINCVVQGKPLWEYLTYVVVLLIGAALFYYRRKVSPKLTASLFLAASFMSLAFGDRGNLSGPVFLCFGLYIFENRKLAVTIGIITALGILGKAVHDGFTIPQTMNFIAGYGAIIATYWYLHFKPRGTKLQTPTPAEFDTIEVVRLLMEGLSYNEIAERQCVTEAAIRKRLYRERKKYGARNNFELIHIMTQRGHIV